MANYSEPEFERLLDGEDIPVVFAPDEPTLNENTPLPSRSAVAALQSCSASINNFLNINVLKPYLLEAGILSASFPSNFLSHGAQIDFLMNVLYRCDEEKFKKVIHLLRVSVPEAGEAHRELADELEAKFEAFKNRYSDNDVAIDGTYHTVDVSNTNVVSATFNSCHENMVSFLNFVVVYPLLNQAGILPVRSVVELQRKDHTTEMLVTKLIEHLCECTEEQFRKVVEILRGTAAEAGDAHIELADELEAKFKELKSKEYSTKIDAFVKAIDDAAANGEEIIRKLAHCMVVGPTGSGKSSLILRLLLKPMKKFSKSTGVCEDVIIVSFDEINPTTFHSAALDSNTWEEIYYEVSLLNQIGKNTILVPTPSNAKLPASKSLRQDQRPKDFKLISQSRRKANHPDFEMIPLKRKPVSKSVISVIKKYGVDTFARFLKQTSFLYLRDTGGQVEFQEMLPLLIFGPSIFFFVFRVDLDFCAKLIVCYRKSENESLNSYTSSITTEEALLQSLASVFAMDTSGKDIIKTHKSLVFIIGTHVDQLGASAEHKLGQLNQHIDSVIRKNGFHKLVQYADDRKGRVIFPVDNTSESDESFAAIRYKVNKLVGYRDEFTIKYPVSYLLFSLDLQNVKKTIISLDEFKDLAANHGIEGDQVFHLLEFLHLRVGVIRYYNVDGLRDIVVLQPQVLFNTITALIVKTFSCEALTTGEVSDFTDKGLVTASAFKCVVKVIEDEEMKRGILPMSAFEGIDQVTDTHLDAKKFLQLAVQLRIIAPIRTEGDQEQKYFIPCVLNHLPKSTLEDYPQTDVLPLAIEFQCKHCPKGVFGVLITYLMTENKSKTTFTLELNKIFKDEVFFTVHSTGVRDMISVKVYTSHLEVKFFPDFSDCRDVSVHFVCQNVRQIMNSSIRQSLKDLHYSEDKLEPFACFKCDTCCELHQVIDGTKFYKIHCTKTRYTSRLPLQGRCWFEESEASSPQMEPVTATLRVEPSVLTMADHYAVTRHLRDLSKEDLIKIGGALGLYYPDLRKMSPLLEELVGAWLNKKKDVLLVSGDPTWASLCKALRDVNHRSVAENIAREYGVSLPDEDESGVIKPRTLTMADHYNVTKHLRDLNKEDLIRMGGALGLYYPHLRTMNPLLEELVASWLNREDNVQSASGDPSWDSLVKALTDINMRGIAETIIKAHPK